MVSSHLVTTTEGHQRKGTRTPLKSLGACLIDENNWSTLAADREAWHHRIQQCVSSFKDTRQASLKDKRQKRKNHKPSSTTDSDKTFVCGRCGWTYLSRIGRTSHERACNRRGRAPSNISSSAKPSH